MTSLMILDQNFLNSIGEYRYCFWYSRFRSTKPNKGKVRVAVEVIGSDGESTTVANLSGRVEENFLSLCGPAVVVPLEVGDIVVWRFRFRKMPRFKHEDGFAGAGYEGRIISPTQLAALPEQGFAPV